MSEYEFTPKAKEHFDMLLDIINNKLECLRKSCLSGTSEQSGIIEAMWYSLMAGGKRIRPVLTLEFCRICGGNIDNSLSAACALEMIHTFSLIHDDLPCMDNDDMRRGKPSCHKAYGEAQALLAGDALLNLAYEIISRDENITPEIKVAVISELSKQVGINGMIGGQVIDTTYTGELNEKTILQMYSMKTSALLKSACKIGCIAAGADKMLEYADIYAEKLGLAFQIIDDILDIAGDEQTLGKPIGSDKECGKTTFASLVGIEKAKFKAKQLTDDAIFVLDKFSDNEFLKELTIYLLKRNY